MKIKYLLGLAMTLTMAEATNAQQLSLQSCLEQGLNNSYQIQVVKINEEKSSNNNTWSNAGGMTSVNMSAGYSGSMYSRDTEARTDGAITSQRDITDHTLNASVNADFTLFNGFKVQATKSRLQELYNIGTIQTKIAIEDYVAGLTSEYYNLVRQIIHLNNLGYAVTLSKERLRIVQERFSLGNNSRLDLQQAQVYFNADSAKSLKQHELISSANIRINKLMSNSDLNIRYTTADTAITLISGLNYESLLSDMLANNTELLRSNSNKTIAELDRKVVQSRNYPYLKLNASYGYTYNIYGSTSTIHRNNWGPNFGATMGINLIDGKHRSEQRNARLDVMSAALESEQLELQLKADLNDFWQAYQNNLKLLQLERENLRTAQENHDIAYERYILGELSGIEMREAQKSLLDAEESLLIVEYDTKICEISLLQISGGVLKYLE